MHLSEIWHSKKNDSRLSRTQVIIVETVKKFEELSDSAPDEIQNLMNHLVDILDGKNFESLFSAIFGYKSYEEATKMPVEYTGGYRGNVKFKDGYRQNLDDAPNLSDSRFAGRLMACAMNIIAKKGNDPYNTPRYSDNRLG